MNSDLFSSLAFVIFCQERLILDQDRWLCCWFRNPGCFWWCWLQDGHTTQSYW